MYQEITSFIAFKSGKETSHKRRSVTLAKTNGDIFMKFLIDIKF